jgi:hypothetical protein
MHDALPVVEPVVVYTVGITARPNIAGAAANEAEPIGIGAQTEEGQVREFVSTAERERAMAILAAEIAAMEAQIEALEAERATFAAAVQARDAQIVAAAEKETALLAQLAALRAELEAKQAALDAGNQKELDQVRAQLLDETKKRELAVAAANEAAPVLQARAMADAAGVLLDCAIGAKLILAADRVHWFNRLTATPTGISAANELFSAERLLKTASVVDAARIAAGNSANGGESAAKRFERAVRTRMKDTGENWPQAWNACQQSHHEIYKLMANGGKA